MSLSACANIADLRLKAKAALPKPIFDIYDGAAFEERTLNANVDDLRALHFRQRVMRDVSGRTLSTTILGQPSSMPAIIAPTGFTGVIYKGIGELYTARAAKTAGVPFILGAMSNISLERVVAEVGPVWFQLFLLKDRGLIQALIDKAKAAQAPVLTVTVSWPLMSRPHRAIRNSITAIPPKFTPQNIWEFASKPKWTLGTLAAGPVKLANFEDIRPGMDFGAIVGQLQDAGSWKDIEWIRSLWPHKLMIKGILDPNDARAAFDSGADAISVSNHGGNCLDDTRSTISTLPRIVEAAGDRGEILMDGGLRSGQDVLKACALGAGAGMLGRAILHGLAAGGEDGVTAALEIVRAEMNITLGYVGLNSPSEVDRNILFEAYDSNGRLAPTDGVLRG